MHGISSNFDICELISVADPEFLDLALVGGCWEDSVGKSKGLKIHRQDTHLS